MELKNDIKYKDMLFSILAVYTFNADIREYIDDQIPIFRNQMMDISRKQILFHNINTEDTSLNINMIMDALFKNGDASYILDLVYYEISHYYCG